MWFYSLRFKKAYTGDRISKHDPIIPDRPNNSKDWDNGTQQWVDYIAPVGDRAIAVFEALPATYNIKLSGLFSMLVDFGRRGKDQKMLECIQAFTPTDAVETKLKKDILDIYGVVI